LAGRGLELPPPTTTTTATMSSEYSYDDEAQFFPFFILTVSALVTLPLTYSLLRRFGF